MRLAESRLIFSLMPGMHITEWIIITPVSLSPALFMLGGKLALGEDAGYKRKCRPFKRNTAIKLFYGYTRGKVAVMFIMEYAKL